MSGIETVSRDNTAPIGALTAALALPLVLLADADLHSRALRARQLQRRGFRVASARTAFEAIVKAACHVPDLILVDDSLGDSDTQTTVDLLANCPATTHIPVVRVTAGRRLPSRLQARVRA